MNAIPSSAMEPWPALPLEAWKDTYATLHLWTQIVGKIRMALTPRVNHYWHVTLYVTPRGLTTSTMRQGSRLLEMRFDFLDHRLAIETSDGEVRHIRLEPRTVADFYREVMATLKELGIEVRLHAKPDEVPDPIPFAQDTVHASYDGEYAQRFWRILASVDAVFQEFRSGFLGKSSPVHFFWGSFDLAVTRFSGRRAPERPGADAITREAYSHEVISVGFWPGAGYKGAAFYAYAAPEPPGFAAQKVKPAAAFYDAGMKEFLLMYDAVRESADPRKALLEFCQSTYEAGANLGGWDRGALEAA
ncbi:MAG TPA: DUF5996 family protein [Terriglobales bacterium]|nr:DUF5996 family protein [Terriglobales bacterium]